MKILTINNIFGGYGEVNILNGVSLFVKKSEIVVGVFFEIKS